ncbi:MAG: pilus assembly protein PilP [Desulfohalobiaceae bacterium]
MRTEKTLNSRWWNDARSVCVPLAIALLVIPSLGVFAPIQGFLQTEAFAQEPQGNATGERPSWIDPSPFQYNPQNKPNPFEPFLRQAPSSQEEETENREALSPLERITPSQLQLEGILSRGGANASVALVKLPDGKGYILRPGTSIGTEGARVKRIEESRVVIREYYIDVMGEKKSKQTVLKLPQSAGENNE